MADPKRRELLALGAGAAAVGAAVWPLARAALAPAEQAAQGERWIELCAEREVGPEPLQFPLRAEVRDGFARAVASAGAAFLFRTAQGELRALSSICPHLGCGLMPAAQGFACPCHESRFAQGGARLSGPSPRGMTPLALKVENGRVLVRLPS